MKTKTLKRRALASPARPHKSWHLRLYVAGQTDKSLAAFSNLKKICESHISGRYSIEVIDLLERPELSKGDQILEQLLIANQELGAFESSVSHDLRGPLRHITGFSQILIESYAKQLPERARELLNKILEGTEKMEGLVVALLEFSRLGKQSLSLQPVDVGRMCHEIIAEMKPELGIRRIDVTIGDLPPCSADPILLRQVFINLIENALKYSQTRDRSVIEITAVVQPGSGSLSYSIKDNGVGFDMKNADRIFTIFQRLHETGDFKGNGVGLATVQRIILRHEGRIWAESTPGAGATFFFTLGPPPSGPFGGAASRATGPPGSGNTT